VPGRRSGTPASDLGAPPDEPPYRTGRTRTIEAALNQPRSRFVSRIEARNAAAVTAAQKMPKKPARSLGSGYRSTDACAKGR
jgi:hypothetical protein